MTRLLFTIILCSALQGVFGQQELHRANTYFDRTFYSDAIPLYEKIVVHNRSKKVLKNLADSYYNIYNMDGAARWYKNLIAKYGETLDESYHLKYSHSLKALGKYAEAEKVLEEYYSSSNNDASREQVQKEFRHLEILSDLGNRFNIKNVSLNTPGSEFSALKVDSSLVYTASKRSKNKKIYRWNNQGYLDLYVHPFDKMNQPNVESGSFSESINTKMHEGTLAITKDRKTIYFTRNNFLKGKKRTDDNKVTNLKIYRAEWSGTAWASITELPFNDREFSTEHPALNKDETALYFSSDRPGGYGSFDLYKVAILPDGNFGNPENLGPGINTNKREQFPFLDAENNLYFASDGHPSFGLLDIFKAEYESGKHLKPINIGLPVNSGYDDFSISFYTKYEGFFASNRPSGKGSDDIYTFQETKPLIIEDCRQSITGILTDKTTKEPIPNGTVKLLDEAGNVLHEILTDSTAYYNFKISCSKSFRLYANRNGYQENSRPMQSTGEHGKTFDGSLQLNPLNKMDSVGNPENAIVKENDITFIRTEKIYFDYNLWYLRKEARNRMEIVIQIMKRHPNMIIEVGTHTDSRGNENYNLDLSQKRANSVKEFLLDNGIENDRVIAKGYGESKPLVKCPNEIDCSEEEHERNRRCEFVVLQWN